MVVLKRIKQQLGLKLKGSSLVEMLVATIIIVILFGIASMTLNNIFSNAIKNNTNAMQTELNKLHYQYNNNRISLPYFESKADWEISVQKSTDSNEQLILFELQNTRSKKKVSKTIYAPAQ